MPANRYRDPPMTLANMREHGVRSLSVACRLCRHQTVMQMAAVLWVAYDASYRLLPIYGSTATPSTTVDADTAQMKRRFETYAQKPSAGRLRALAVTTSTRFEMLPDLPRP
jgi:tripartite-type tricarboxylate transporter receptor subunit TctC